MIFFWNSPGDSIQGRCHGSCFTRNFLRDLSRICVEYFPYKFYLWPKKKKILPWQISCFIVVRTVDICKYIKISNHNHHYLLGSAQEFIVDISDKSKYHVQMYYHYYVKSNQTTYWRLRTICKLLNEHHKFIKHLNRKRKNEDCIKFSFIYVHINIKRMVNN